MRWASASQALLTRSSGSPELNRGVVRRVPGSAAVEFGKLRVAQVTVGVWDLLC